MSPPVLVVVKIDGCPACIELSSKLDEITRELRSIPQLSSMRSEVIIITPADKSIPYAIRGVTRVPMMFLVPGSIWDAAKAHPSSNIPLTGSSIYNGEWVHHKPVFLAVQKYRRNPGEAVSVSYLSWAKDTVKDRVFSRVQGEGDYPAVEHRDSSASSSSSSSSSTRTTSSSSSMRKSKDGEERPPCTLKVIRYKSASKSKN